MVVVLRPRFHQEMKDYIFLCNICQKKHYHLTNTFCCHCTRMKTHFHLTRKDKVCPVQGVSFIEEGSLVKNQIMMLKKKNRRNLSIDIRQSGHEEAFIGHEIKVGKFSIWSHLQKTNQIGRENR